MIGYGRILTGLVVVAAVGAGGCAHRAAPPELRPALTGRWVLTRAGAETDTATAAAPGNSQPTPERERRGGRDGYGGERGEGSGGYSRSLFDPAAVRAAMDAVVRGDSVVTIAQDSLVHFEFADGSYFDVRPDGRLRDDIWRGVGRIRSGAHWAEAGLVLERKVEDTGVTVTQTFARPAGGPMIVTTSVKGSGAPRPLTMKRQYTLAGAASAAHMP